ncbi:restriction endonuclease subunit S [Desulfovibrio oxamicus]|uniref:Restriction endonuclease subunit S n=1 Tax=Nitratidesulfovibrio oxamicus TaxID=32016 RepID=A0ABS0J4U7_9BACT|nr:restriction endonuclease subunit S [Nitratidesulfovibrio oxamicus]MBG3877462.1 restriction endonuclease subunit S [Nitratidesulfovibrio oxamicus]
MSFPTYPDYKDSGVEWLGEVPSHWNMISLKRIANLKSGTTISPDLIEEKGTYPVYGGNGLRGYTHSYTHDGFYPLIGRQGALCGNLNYASGKFWASEHAIVVTKTSTLSEKWLGELLRAMKLGQYSISAAQPGLSVEVITCLRIPIPPVSEQSLIASFLDHETAKIDALIAEQQTLIELLKEKRQAVISHAVTKGLDPNAPMKDSGMTWLGNVPQHWTVLHLKRTFLSYDYGISEPLFPDGGIAVLRMGNIQDGKIIYDDIKYTEHTPSELLLANEDLLFNRTNSLELIGKVGLFIGNDKYPTSFASYLVRIRMRDSFDPYFFSFLLNTQEILGEARSLAFISIGQCNLNPSRYSQLLIAAPPFDEQKKISSFLEIETKNLEQLINEAQHAISLLKERRSALISAAVTGKIDVRGYAPQPEAA